MVIIFALVLLILSKAGFPVITRMVQKRSDHIEEALRKAEQAQEALQGLAQEQQKMIEQTKMEQLAIMKQTAELRDKMLLQARHDAQEQAAQIVSDARKEIAKEREDALREISHQLSLLSVQVAEKILRENLSHNEAQDALISRYVDEVAKDRHTHLQ